MAEGKGEGWGRGRMGGQRGGRASHRSACSSPSGRSRAESDSRWGRVTKFPNAEDATHITGQAQREQDRKGKR